MAKDCSESNDLKYTSVRIFNHFKIDGKIKIEVTSANIKFNRPPSELPKIQSNKKEIINCNSSNKNHTL